MSWSFSSKNGYLIATESIVAPGTAATDRSTSVIDWLRPGEDFMVIANTLATDVSAIPLDVDVCLTSDGTFTPLKETLFATIGAVAKAAFYDVSANGESPFYKLRLDGSASVPSGNTLTIGIVQKAKA